MPRADVSDAQEAYLVLPRVLPQYPSVQIVIADCAYDCEGLLEWLLQAWSVALDCVRREGSKGFQGLPRRWLVERRSAGLLCCRQWSWCYDELCEVEAAWMMIASMRRLVRWMAGKKC